MTKPNTETKEAKISTPFIIGASAVALIAVGLFVSSKVQQSDPTLTHAPPPSPGAVTLIGSPAKLATGPMYVPTATGMKLNPNFKSIGGSGEAAEPSPMLAKPGTNLDSLTGQHSNAPP